jgi:phosphate:Na+ symporter
MLISFVDSNLIKFRNTMAVTMGAALGTTITIQLIAFKVTDYSMVLIAIGFIMAFLWQNSLIKNIGHSILGTGLLFLGLYFMSDSIVPLKSYEPFYHALMTMENPLAGILAGCIITALTQSSGMFIGIVVILGGQGLISLEAAIPMLLGSNLGTSVTAIIASVGRTTDARRVALSHTLYRVAGIIFLIGWIGPFSDLVRSITPDGFRQGHDISGQIANAHTLFYILFTLVSFPLISWYSKLTEYLFKGREEPEYARLEARYLDKSLFNSPSIALNLSRRETVRMIHLVQDMLNDILLPFLTKERSVLNNIRKLEDVINFLQKEIQQYTIQLISNQNNPEIINEGYKIIAVSKECEQIADIIVTNLLPRAEKWVDGNYEFSNEGKKEIILFQNESQQILNDVLHCFEQNNKTGASQAKKSYKHIRNKALEFEKSHYQRLRENNPLSQGSSEIHIELIGMLNAIARHASNIAKIIEDKSNRSDAS